MPVAGRCFGAFALMFRCVSMLQAVVGLAVTANKFDEAAGLAVRIGTEVLIQRCLRLYKAWARAAMIFHLPAERIDRVAHRAKGARIRYRDRFSI